MGETMACLYCAGKETEGRKVEEKGDETQQVRKHERVESH